jgi:fimbrial chaperone protein
VISDARPKRILALRFGAYVLGAALAICMCSAPAAAAGFTVSPTRIELSARASSALLTVKNDSNQALQLQVSAFAWTQSPAGEIQLAPTADVIFFPALLSLEPGAERRVRVGTTARPRAAEQTYRIFVEQLPSSAADTGIQNGVRVLTKVGIPIFLQPARSTATPRLRDLGLHGSTFAFRLVNDGTAHFVPGELRVQARDGAGATVPERPPPGWYVLAGSHRIFEVALADARCADIRAVAVTAVVDGRTLSERLETPHGTCGP